MCGRLGRAPTSAAAICPAGSAWAPKPITTSSRMTASAGVGQRRAQLVGAHGGIDHRMRAAAGEFVGAEIDDAVGAAPARASSGFAPGTGGVGADAAAGAEQDELRFRAQRAAGVKAEDCAGLRRQHVRGIGEAERSARRARPRRRRARSARHRALAGRFMSAAPRKQMVKGLRLCADARQHRARHLRMRRLGDQHDVPRRRVGVEQVDGGQRRERADLAARDRGRRRRSPARCPCRPARSGR